MEVILWIALLLAAPVLGPVLLAAVLLPLSRLLDWSAKGGS